MTKETFTEKIKKILLPIERFQAITEEDIIVLNSAKIRQLAREYDTELLTLLQKDEEIKNHFFTKINDSTVFKLRTFIAFIDNYTYMQDSLTIYKKRIGLAINETRFLTENKYVVLN